MANPEAPLFTDIFNLVQWLVENCADQHSVLQRRIQGNALSLLDNIALALKNHQRIERLEQIDRNLIILRVELRLAESAHLLTEQQLLHCLKLTDSIGRQLGGWLRRLDLA